MPTQVWDGRRPRSARTVIDTHQAGLFGLHYRFVHETVHTPTDWCFQELHHTFVIHLRGALTRMEIEFEDGPSGPQLPQLGDIWVIPAGSRYAALAQGDSVGFCEIAVPTSLFGDAPIVPRVGYHDVLLHRLIERLDGQITQGGPIATLFRQSLAETTRMHLAEHYGPRSAGAPPDASTTLDGHTKSAVLDYLQSTLDDSIDLPTLAGLAGMPVRRFLDAFSAAFSTTPHQLLLDLRIQRAKALLAGTDDSVTEIGARLGFASPSHFSTTFKQRTGLSPTAYRMAQTEAGS